MGNGAALRRQCSRRFSTLERPGRNGISQALLCANAAFTPRILKAAAATSATLQSCPESTDHRLPCPHSCYLFYLRSTICFAAPSSTGNEASLGRAEEPLSRRISQASYLSPTAESL